MRCLQTPDRFHVGHDLPQHEAAAGHVVSRDDESTQAKGGISSIALARRLGVRQPTACLMKQKLMFAMDERNAGKPKLSGRFELDDSYLGGVRSGGKRQAWPGGRRRDAVRRGRRDELRSQPKRLRG